MVGLHYKKFIFEVLQLLAFLLQVVMVWLDAYIIVFKIIHQFFLCCMSTYQVYIRQGSLIESEN